MARYSAYGWTPWDFIRLGLLRFCFTEDEDRRTQVGFVEQRVRVQLARLRLSRIKTAAAPSLSPLRPQVPATRSSASSKPARQPRSDADGTVIRDFHDLIDEIAARCDPGGGDPDWQAGAQPGTLCGVRPAADGSRAADGSPRRLSGCHVFELNRHFTVVDIHSLHDAAQRFVVGALLTEIFDSKQGTGREPLRFILLDELNKYAPRDRPQPDQGAARRHRRARPVARRAADRRSAVGARRRRRRSFATPR